jgi:threonine dehydratase
MLRFSSNVSLIAAQISSVFTVTISGSTIGPEANERVILPHVGLFADGTAVAQIGALPFDIIRLRKSDNSKAAFKQADSSYSTPITFTCGATSPR